MTLTEAEEYAKKHWKCVVLCRECRLWKVGEDGLHECAKGYNCELQGEDNTDARNWYCADGERRQEQEAGYDQNH